MQKIASPRVCGRLRTMWLPLSVRHQPRRLASDSSKDDDENAEKKLKPAPKAQEPSTDRSAASAKLNDLLQTIIKEDLMFKVAEPLKLSTAQNKKGAFKKIKSAAAYQLGQEMADAIGNVTKSYDGDKDRMQAELVDKVVSLKTPSVEHVVEESVPKEDAQPPSEPINLSELIVGMKIDRSKPKVQFESMSRSSQVRSMMDARSSRQDVDTKVRRRPEFRQFSRDDTSAKAGLSESVPLGIFTDVASTAMSEPFLPVWDKMQQRELRMAITQPPANIFEEMMVWTNQGKLWKFPINNEQGMEEEEKVPFSEHIFLEKHIEGWCPKKGPVRHFMELVCNGLSKNPHYSAEEKKAHIQGYREYFDSKKDLLKELGAL